MSTFIINLNDTTALSDSVIAKVIKLSDAFQPVVTEAETNCNDVMIVGIVCLAIVLVALIAKCTVRSWQKAGINAANVERNAKEKEADIAERKKKADALNKLIDYLARNTSEEKYNDEAGKVIKTEKGLATDEGCYYLEVLRTVIEGGKIPQYPLKKTSNENKATQQN